MTVQVQSVSKTDDTVDVIFRSTLARPVVIVTPATWMPGSLGWPRTSREVEAIRKTYRSIY